MLQQQAQASLFFKSLQVKSICSDISSFVDIKAVFGTEYFSLSVSTKDWYVIVVEICL